MPLARPPLTHRPIVLIAMLSGSAVLVGAWELAVTRLASVYFFYDVTYLVLALCLAGLSLGALWTRRYGDHLRLRILLILLPASMLPIWWLIAFFELSWFTLLFTWPFALFGAASTLAWHRLEGVTSRSRLYAAELLGTVAGLALLGPAIVSSLPMDVFGNIGITSHLRHTVKAEGLRHHQHATSSYARTDLVFTGRTSVAYVFTDGMFLTRSVQWDGIGEHFDDPDIESLAALKRMAMASGPVKDVVLLGAGAGFDMAVALQQGAGHVDAVEVNADTIAFARSLDPWAGDVLSNSRVDVHIAEARRFMTTSAKQWDHISLTLLQTSPASGRGRTHIDGRVLTAEAIETYLTRLKPGGQIAVLQNTRHLAVRTAATILKANGGHPERVIGFHLPSSDSAYNPFSFLILARNESFTEPEKRRLLDIATQHGAIEGTFMADPVTKDHVEAFTDDRPFLFEPGERLSIHATLAFLLTLLLLSIVLARERHSSVNVRRGAAATIVGILGMTLQVLVVYRVQAVIGNPSLAMGLALAALLGGAGLGALVLAPRLTETRSMFRACLLASIGVGAFALLGPVIADGANTLPPTLSPIAMVTLVVLCALPVGLPFIAVIQSCSELPGHGEGLAIGCDGLGAILGATLATLLAVTSGFNMIALSIVVGFIGVSLLRID